MNPPSNSNKPYFLQILSKDRGDLKSKHLALVTQMKVLEDELETTNADCTKGDADLTGKLDTQMKLKVSNAELASQMEKIKTFTSNSVLSVYKKEGFEDLCDKNSLIFFTYSIFIETLILIHTINEEKMAKVSPEYNQEGDNQWTVQLNTFKNDFNKWISENETIDKFIQDAQINADGYRKNVKQIEKVVMVLSIIRSGMVNILKDGALKINNGKEANMHNSLEKQVSFIFYGITEDPETHKYMTKKKCQQKTISGVLPYIALSGKNIQRLLMFIYLHLFAYGFPHITHDEDLAFKTCNGFRPNIPFHTFKSIIQIIMQCRDARITHRLYLFCGFLFIKYDGEAFKEFGNIELYQNLRNQRYFKYEK
ncbi:hypothetical protein Glove_117g438 [Diversispora epigaea]|uniref:Uncharacterized protein n=1 Tax=Diversispora epigaea TaxID=1348612 RepID=A0A397J9V7_9GLOM|nr:hypothetical protein Glove_117g438 [Diversispora epigaea]